MILKPKIQSLIDQVVALVVDDALQILKVDAAKNQDHDIVGPAGIGQNDLGGILAVTAHESSLGVNAALIGHNHLIGAILIEILYALTVFLAHTGTALAQVEHLHRCDAEAGIGQRRRQQSPKSQQATTHVEVLRMPGIPHVVNDIIGVVRHDTA